MLAELVALSQSLRADRDRRRWVVGAAGIRSRPPLWSPRRVNMRQPDTANNAVAASEMAIGSMSGSYPDNTIHRAPSMTPVRRLRPRSARAVETSVSG